MKTATPIRGTAEARRFGSDGMVMVMDFGRIELWLRWSREEKNSCKRCERMSLMNSKLSYANVSRCSNLLGQVSQNETGGFEVRYVVVVRTVESDSSRVRTTVKEVPRLYWIWWFTELLQWCKGPESSIRVKRKDTVVMDGFQDGLLFPSLSLFHWRKIDTENGDLLKSSRNNGIGPVGRRCERLFPPYRLPVRLIE